MCGDYVERKFMLGQVGLVYTFCYDIKTFPYRQVILTSAGPTKGNRLRIPATEQSYTDVPKRKRQMLSTTFVNQPLTSV